MKKSILLILLICFKSFSQDLEFENFKNENEIFTWQKVYESELTKENIVKYFKNSGLIKDFEFSENTITGNIENIDLDFKGFGKTEMNTAMYISRSYLKSFILIELKENKYRVSLKEIKLIQKYNDGLTEEGVISELKDYAIKNNNSDFRNIFKKNSSGILNFTFDKLFLPKNKKSNDW